MVRKATVDDAPLIARMLDDFNSEFDEPTPGAAVLEPRVRAFIESDEKIYLLEGSGPDGFAQVAFHASVWADQPVGLLDELYVVPERRGRGIGTSLMEAILELARERGAAGMEVVTGEDDVAARRLYERFGFANEIEGQNKARSLFYELNF